jgi:phage protein D
MTIRGYDNSMKMGLRPRNRPWQGTTSQPIDLESIVRQIAREHGFSSLNVELRGNPTFPHNGIRQQDETDLAFLQRLARTFGCELFVEPNEDDDTLNFVSQYSIMNSDPEVTLYYARCDVDHHLRRFDPRSSVSDIHLPRAYSGIDYDSGEPTEVTRADIAPVHTSEDDFLDENMLSFSQQSPERAPQVEALIAAAPAVQTQLRTEMGGVQRVAVPAFVTQETLSHLSLNQFSTSLNGMRASGETPGNHRLHAQNNVGIANVGGRFSNTWYLSRVTHTLDGRGYSTTFECER